jgi:IS30 family transposase
MSWHRFPHDFNSLDSGIWADKRCGGQLFQHLRRKGKAYRPRNTDKQAERGFIKNRVSIDGQPAVVDKKVRMGD